MKTVCDLHAVRLALGIRSLSVESRGRVFVATASSVPQGERIGDGILVCGVAASFEAAIDRAIEHFRHRKVLAGGAVS